MGSRESKAATLIHLRLLSFPRFAAGAGETVGLGKLGCAEAANPGRKGPLFPPQRVEPLLQPRGGQRPRRGAPCWLEAGWEGACALRKVG